jgi:hypothetical protein
MVWEISVYYDLQQALSQASYELFLSKMKIGRLEETNWMLAERIRLQSEETDQQFDEVNTLA